MWSPKVTTGPNTKERRFNSSPLATLWAQPEGSHNLAKLAPLPLGWGGAVWRLESKRLSFSKTGRRPGQHWARGDQGEGFSWSCSPWLSPGPPHLLPYQAIQLLNMNAKLTVLHSFTGSLHVNLINRHSNCYVNIAHFPIMFFLHAGQIYHQRKSTVWPSFVLRHVGEWSALDSGFYNHQTELFASEVQSWKQSRVQSAGTCPSTQPRGPHTWGCDFREETGWPWKMKPWHRITVKIWAPSPPFPQGMVLEDVCVSIYTITLRVQHLQRMGRVHREGKTSRRCFKRKAYSCWTMDRSS